MCTGSSGADYAQLGDQPQSRIRAVFALGFGLFPGFPERVIFRQPSCRGLCVLDVAAVSLYNTRSHTGALAEVRALLGAVIGESVPEEAVLVGAGAPAERRRRQET